MITSKSDDIFSRREIQKAIENDKETAFNTKCLPESTKLLVNELRGLGLKAEILSSDGKTICPAKAPKTKEKHYVDNEKYDFSNIDFNKLTSNTTKRENRLRNSDLKLATTFARKKFSGIFGNYSFEEIKEICLLEVCKARSKFDPRKKTKFSTYATSLMNSAIAEYVRGNSFYIDVEHKAS